MRVTSILQGASAGISVVSFENSLVDWNVKWRSTILMIDLACDCRKVAHFLWKSTGPQPPTVKTSSTLKHVLRGKLAPPKWMRDAFYGRHGLNIEARFGWIIVPPTGCPSWPKKPLFCTDYRPEMNAFYDRHVLNIEKSVLPETECPRNGCLSAKTLLNSQRETYFLLKPDAPKTNAFHVKDVVNIEPFLFDTMPPKWMPLWTMFSMWSQFF